MTARSWTLEEELYLEEKIGAYSLKTIAKKLNRSYDSVYNKAYYMRLGNAKSCFDGVTLLELSRALDIHYGIVSRWINDHELPVMKKVFFKNKAIKCIKRKDFWKWAEKHKQVVNFARLEKYSLGPEPEWVDKKRHADKMNLTKKKKKKAWTEEEDKLLISLVHAFCYTYPEIAARVQRSESACKRRLYDLKIKARPVRAKNRFWTSEEEATMERMCEEGYGLNSIAEKVNRTSLAVRGKLETMGYSFRNELPVKNDHLLQKVL